MSEVLGMYVQGDWPRLPVNVAEKLELGAEAKRTLHALITEVLNETGREMVVGPSSLTLGGIGVGYLISAHPPIETSDEAAAIARRIDTCWQAASMRYGACVVPYLDTFVTPHY
jgi:hypothetical protein